MSSPKTNKNKERPADLADQFRELKQLRLEVAKAEAESLQATRPTGSCKENASTQKRSPLS